MCSSDLALGAALPRHHAASLDLVVSRSGFVRDLKCLDDELVVERVNLALTKALDRKSVE